MRAPGGCAATFEMAPAGDPIHVLATADPPVHTRRCTLLWPHLSPGAVSRLEPALCAVEDELLRPFRPDRPVTGDTADSTRATVIRIPIEH